MATQKNGMELTKYEDIDFSIDRYWRVEVTPDIARQMISMNHKKNRDEKRRREQYQRDMERGRWVVGDGNTVKFDTDGILFDGANRLRAVIASGKTITLDIKTGCPKSAMMTVDDIAVRTNADAIKIALGMVDQNNVAAISNLVQLLRNGAYNTGTHVGVGVKPTRQEIVEFASKNEKEIRTAIQIGRKATRLGVKRMGIRLWFACYWLTSIMNEKKAEEFYESVCAIDGVGEAFVEDALMKDPETGRQKPAQWICYKYVREFDRLMMHNKREVGGTPEKVAAAYKGIWKEYVDNMIQTKDVGFTFIKK